MLRFLKELFVSENKELKEQMKYMLELQTEFLDLTVKLDNEIKQLKENNKKLNENIRVVEHSFVYLSQQVKETLEEDKDELEAMKMEGTLLRRVTLMSNLLEKHELPYDEKIRLHNLGSTVIDYLENEITTDHKKYLSNRSKKNKKEKEQEDVNNIQNLLNGFNNKD